MHVQPGPSALRLTRRARASQVAGLLAAVALMGFILFEALDLDGLAEAFSNPKTAPLITTPVETDSERSVAQPRQAEIVEVASQPAASISVIAQSYGDMKRNSGRRLSHRMIPHATPPPPADPL